MSLTKRRLTGKKIGLSFLIVVCGFTFFAVLYTLFNPTGKLYYETLTRYQKLMPEGTPLATAEARMTALGFICARNKKEHLGADYLRLDCVKASTPDPDHQLIISAHYVSDEVLDVHLVFVPPL